MKWTRINRDRNHPAGIARYKIIGNTGYIWCAGTETRREWLWNLDTRTIRMGDRRYNRRCWNQAQAVMDAMPEDLKYCRNYVVCGYSRGASVAISLSYMLGCDDGTPILFAPKRAGIGLPRFGACHRSGDIVPYLPFWYNGYRLGNGGKWDWPWRAHIAAAKDAARWRHLIEKGER